MLRGLGVGGSDAGGKPEQCAERSGIALPQDAVALALIFSRVPFYDYYTHAPRLIESLDPVIDQTVAGAVLMTLGKLTIAIAAIAIFIRWFATEHEEDQASLTRA